MALTAKLDGVQVVVFDHDNDGLRRLRAFEAGEPGRLRMACCDSRAVIRLRTELRRPHFAHWPGAALTERCESEPKSEAHIRLQELIYLAAPPGWVVALEESCCRATSGYRIADVLLTAPWGHRYAVEVQLAPQPDDDYRDRSRHYLAHGITPVWLVHADAAPADPRFAFPPGTLRADLAVAERDPELGDSLVSPHRPVPLPPHLATPSHRSPAGLFGLLDGSLTARSHHRPTSTVPRLPAGRTKTRRAEPRPVPKPHHPQLTLPPQSHQRADETGAWARIRSRFHRCSECTRESWTWEQTPPDDSDTCTPAPAQVAVVHTVAGSWRMRYIAPPGLPAATLAGSPDRVVWVCGCGAALDDLGETTPYTVGIPVPPDLACRETGRLAKRRA